MIERIAQWTKHSVILRSKPTITLFPDFTVRVKDVSIIPLSGASSEPLVSMMSLEGSVRLLPLFLGRIEFSKFYFNRPHFNFFIDPQDGANWFLSKEEAKEGKKQNIHLMDSIFAGGQFGELFIREGTISFLNKQLNQREEMTALNLHLTWPRVENRATLAGSFVWHGQIVNADVYFNDLLAFIRHKKNTIQAKITSTPFDMSFDGRIFIAGQNHFEGTLSASGPSLRGWLKWIGNPMEPGSTLGPFNLKATAKITGTTASFTDAKIILDENLAEGAVALGLGGETPFLQGTLHFPSLNLTPYLESLTKISTLTGPSNWRFHPLSITNLNGLDTDIRISSDHVILGQLISEKMATSIVTKNGRLSIGLGDAELYGGHLQANFTIDQQGDAIYCKGMFNLRNIELNPLLGNWFEEKMADGSLTMDMEFNSHGSMIQHWLDNLNGASKVVINNGTVVGIDLKKIMTSFIDNKEVKGNMLNGGQTNFNQLRSVNKFENGIFISEDIALEMDDLKFTFEGASNLLNQKLNFTGLVQVPAQNDTMNLMPLSIHGSWSQPILQSGNGNDKLEKEQLNDHDVQKSTPNLFPY